MLYLHVVETKHTKEDMKQKRLQHMSKGTKNQNPQLSSSNTEHKDPPPPEALSKIYNQT